MKKSIPAERELLKVFFEEKESIDFLKHVGGINDTIGCSICCERGSDMIIQIGLHRICQPKIRRSQDHLKFARGRYLGVESSRFAEMGSDSLLRMVMIAQICEMEESYKQQSIDQCD